MYDILSKFREKRSLSKSRQASSTSFDNTKQKQSKLRDVSEGELNNCLKKKKKSMIRHKSTSSETDVAKLLPKSHTSPGSINFAIRTKRGVSSAGKKINQDSFVTSINFRGSLDEHLFGVFDGHGFNGHLVSNFVSSNITNILAAKLLQNQSPEIALHYTFKTLHDLLMGSNIDVTFSGTTAVTCFLQGESLYCANVGDSRAILGYELPDGNFTFKKLSQDHKLSLEEERTRIEQAGGIVQSYIDEEGAACGPLRVWLPGKNVPGLAMSRSIGDLVAASIGVQWQPGNQI